MNIRKVNFIAVIFFILISQNLTAQLTINQIIDKHLDVIGLKSGNEIKSFEISGDLIQNKFTLPMEMFGIMPDYQLMNMMFNGIAFIKASNGEFDWELNPMKDTLTIKKGKKSQAKNFYSRWTGGLSEFKSGEITGELLGIVNIEDIEVYKLKLQKDNKTRIYYIDKLSFLIVRIDDEDPEKQKMTYYSDYKKVDGFLLAHKLIGFEFGQQVMVMKFNSVKINIEIEKEIFNVPDND